LFVVELYTVVECWLINRFYLNQVEYLVVQCVCRFIFLFVLLHCEQADVCQYNMNLS